MGVITGPGEGADQAGQLRDTDDLLVGDVAHVCDAGEGQRVVLAQRRECDRALGDHPETLDRERAETTLRLAVGFYDGIARDFSHDESMQEEQEETGLRPQL